MSVTWLLYIGLMDFELGLFSLSSIIYRRLNFLLSDSEIIVEVWGLFAIFNFLLVVQGQVWRVRAIPNESYLVQEVKMEGIYRMDALIKVI